jgi:hypothetical protein
MTRLTRTLTALAAAATLTFAAVAMPQPAEARGGRVAAGIIGGIASNGYGYYGPRYYAPAPIYYGPRCWWTRERIWDGYGWRLRRVRVCD